MRLRVAPPLALLVVAALLAGCGDDDEPTTTTTSGTTGAAGAISVEQWTDAAERICGEGDRAQQQAAEQRFGDEPPTDEELEEFGTSVVVPNLLAQQQAIEALPVPEAEAGRIEEMLAALGAGVDAVAEDPGALVQGSDSVPAIAEATRLAEELGLTDCGAG